MCNEQSLPSSVELIGIPGDINTAMVPHDNETLLGMQRCCSPNKVHVAPKDSCYLWCEIPDGLVDESNVADGMMQGAISKAIADCIELATNSSTPRWYGAGVAHDGGGDGDPPGAASNAKVPTVLGAAILAITIALVQGVAT